MAIVGVLTTAILSQVQETYTATALIVIDPGTHQLTATPNDVTVFQLANSIVDSEVAMLRSYEIGQRAISATQPVADLHSQQSTVMGDVVSLVTSAVAREQNRIGYEIQTAMDLLDRTTIERLGQSFVIRVDVSDPSPERAADLANALIDAHLSARRETRFTNASVAETALATRVADLAINLRSVEGRIDDMLLAAAAANLAREGGVTPTQNEAVANILDHLSNERRSLFAERADLTRLLRSEATSGVNSAETLEDLHDRRAEIDEELAVLETTTANVRQQLQDFLDPDNLGPSLSLSVQRLQSEAQALREIYQDALQRWRRAQLVTPHQSQQTRILSRAVPPVKSDQPRRLYVGLVGLMASISLGVGLGLVREHVWLGVFDVDIIERTTHLPIVAVLPRVSRFDANAPQDLVRTLPACHFTEGVRRIARNLHTSPNLQRHEQKALCVLMTSSRAGEGKSTLALAYAMLEATSGKSTLLIDADLRQSALYDRLHWQMDGVETQLSDVLAGQGTMADIGNLTFCDPETGLHVLGNVTPPLETADTLLVSDRFCDLVDAARNKYDVIVIDSAPALQANDAHLLLTHADATVIAMRCGKTRLPTIQKTLLSLRQHHAPPVFGVLTFAEQASIAA